MKIGLKDFRAFADTGLIDIKPITFLVGDNSSGKTSFLAALNYVWRLSERFGGASFNAPPFDLGTFDEIVHRVRGRNRPECFSIELEEQLTISSKRLSLYSEEDVMENISGIARLSVRLKNNIGEAFLYEMDLSFNEFSLSLKFGDKLSITIRENGDITLDSEKGQGDLGFGQRRLAIAPFDISFLEIYLRRSLYDEKLARKKGDDRLHASLSIVAGALEALTARFPRAIFASAPVRSNPERVYRTSDRPRLADGTNTPQALFRIKSSDENRWLRIRTGLEEFGKISGLFQTIDISRYKRAGSSPFQINVSFRGRQSNIVDVGYGVSQILPILTELIEAPTHSSFLFQQPEVHLHPRAQAALGSFFAKYIAEHRGSFLIAETHSDYLIDRVRREARNKRIPYQDIAILYFASEGNKTVIHQMSVSKDGDIVNPPDSYRDFFVREQMAMLGIETH